MSRVATLWCYLEVFTLGNWSRLNKGYRVAHIFAAGRIVHQVVFVDPIALTIARVHLN